MPYLSSIWTLSRHEGLPQQVHLIPHHHPVQPSCWCGMGFEEAPRGIGEGGCKAAAKWLSGSRPVGGRAGRAEARRSWARGSPSGSCVERSGELAGRAQRPAEKGQRRRRLPASARLITRSPLAADLREQINQRARLDEICCYCAHF